MAEEKITVNDQTNKTANNINPDDRRAIYAAIIQLVCNAEQISWNRLYNFLTCNSILILAWAALQSLQKPGISVKIFLTGICLLGFLLGILWAVQGHRGRRFLNYYVHFGKRMETDLNYMPMPLGNTVQLRDSFDVLGNENDPNYEFGKNLRDMLYNLCGSSRILIIVPSLFSALFIIMIVITWV